jgi:hypothetical protein
MDFLEGSFEGIKVAFAGAVILATIGGVAYGAAQTIAGNSPTDGWTGKPVVKECIVPGEAISGTAATGVGHIEVGSGPSCFMEDEGGKKLYYREQVLP